MSATAIRTLQTANGASIAVVERAGEELVEVRDAECRLIFEFDPRTGKATLSLPAGDLSVRAPMGDIELVAGGTMRLKAGTGVEIEAGEGAKRSSFSLRDALTSLSAKTITLTTDRLETFTGKLFERARSVFRNVEDLHQLKAGRTRTVVREGYVVRSGHASIESREETKIDGAQIHLG